ncbi:PadR family transcriptional regulator [Martelella limonii]|uniref:PadR family transcriptional regulator n=1 Tax=Martelella limonii TaxID=1647649 RepID=UPI00157FBF0F|nr:helix-turn-helix transcriptional regulator [Martelella limonii]
MISANMEILVLLSSGERLYGIQMVKRSSILKRGSVYVHLARLEATGLVSSEEEQEETIEGFPRRIYSITDKGRAACRAATEAATAVIMQGVTG